MADVEIVNIAASGDLEREIHIQQLVEDVCISVANYDPDFNASFLRFDEDSSELVILYTSGKYILRGGDSYQSMENLHNRFVELLSDIGIEVGTIEYDIKNVVCVADLEQSVDLNRLMIVLGMENVEYEPEQFPGLVYRPSNSSCVLMIFSTGKVVVTGGRSKEDAEESFRSLESEISDPL